MDPNNIFIAVLAFKTKFKYIWHFVVYILFVFSKIFFYGAL